MARILVLGAGFGGIPCSLELRARLGREHQVTLVDQGDHFLMGLSKLWAIYNGNGLSFLYRISKVCVYLNRSSRYPWPDMGKPRLVHGDLSWERGLNPQWPDGNLCDLYPGLLHGIRGESDIIVVLFFCFLFMNLFNLPFLATREGKGYYGK